MPRSTEPVDYEAMFKDAGELDDLPGTGELAVNDPTPPIEEQVEEEEPQAEYVAPPQSHVVEEEEPAQPQLTADQEADQERQRILSLNQQILREQQAFERKYGKPLIDPKVVEERQRIASARDEMVKDTPALADGVRGMVNDAMNEVAQHTQDVIEAQTEEQMKLLHDATVTAMAPSYPDYVADPSPLLTWIDELPGWASEEYKRIFNTGLPEEVAGMIADFESYPDPAEAIQVLEQQRSGGVEQEQEEAPAEPQARRQPSRATRAPAAALAVRSRGTAPLPTASSAPVADEFDAAYTEWGMIEARQARQGAN